MVRDMDAAVTTIERLLQNLENGFCPVSLKAAYVIVKTPYNLTKAGAVTFMLNLNYPIEETPEMELLGQVCEDDPGGGASAYLLQLMSIRPSLAAAAPDLVNHAIASGLAEEASRARLTRLWTTWLKGTTWAKCTITPRNRPSLASWKGWPWDWSNVLERSLYAGVTGRSVRVQEGGEPESLVGPELAHRFKMVWDEGLGRVRDVRDALEEAAMEAC